VINGLNRAKKSPLHRSATPSPSPGAITAGRTYKVDLYYDRDLGWFAYESGPELFRVWTPRRLS
jgi:hypothetical protein